MQKFKIIVFTLIICVIGLTGFSVHALESEEIINHNGIKILKEEYQNLLNLGFNESEIFNMTTKEYLENRNLKGEIVSENIIYFDDKNNVMSMDNDQMISPFGMQPGYIESPGKKMTTTIVSVNGKYRYKVSLEWKKIPSTRSYDIIGIGLDGNVKIDSGLVFQQNFCYSSNNCSSSTVHTGKSTSTGATATFQIPTQSIISLSSYLYFDVNKNTNSTITKLNAYGDYAHATKTISKSNANKHSINSSGIVLESSISNYYDTMDKSTATWTGSW